MVLMFHRYLQLMIERVNYMIVILDYRYMVVMMMMYNQDYVSDLIVFDQMDVDVNDEIHLEMVVENKEVEIQLYQNSMKQVSMMMKMMFDYVFDLELMKHCQNYLIDPKHQHKLVFFNYFSKEKINKTI